ncbi:MAG TPA: hypothetical protein P5084_05695 [Paludibacter sp.]|nr:hypothetical protein [Paludibacter sp.]
MKICRLFFVLILVSSSSVLFGQSGQLNNPFVDKYYFYKSFESRKAFTYKDIVGSPYLNNEFVEGTFNFKDTVPVKIPLRYNIFRDEIEYQEDGINYVVGNPQALNSVSIGESVLVYLPFIEKGGYYEVNEMGKCTLLQKRLVKLKPAEEPKAIVGVAIPAEFVRKFDVYYLVVNETKSYKIKNMKSVLTALNDQQSKLKDFIKKEKINNVKKNNLIKIVKYYNSL